MVKINRLILAIAILFLGFSLAGAFEGKLTEEEVKGSLETIRLNEIFNQYLATIEMYDPERATLLGVHGSDALLTRRNREQQDKMLFVFKKLRSKLKRIDKDALYENLQIDLELLDHMLQTDIYNIQNLELLKKRPQYYLEPLFAIYVMLNRDYDSYNVRAANALSRIKLFPKVLLEAERNLSHPPKIWTMEAIKEADAAIKSLPDFFFLLKSYSRYDPVLKTQVNDALSDMRAALERYRDFLKNEILPSSDGDFRVGKFTYGFYLERWHGLNITPRKARSISKRIFKRSMKKFKKEAFNIDPLVYKSGGWIGVFNKLLFEHPEREDIARTFQNEVERAYQHFDEFKVVRFPRQRVLIKEMPAFMKIIKPYAYYLPSFALDSNKVSDFYIAIPEKGIPKAVLKKILKRAYSYALIELLVTHSLMPGLHLQDWQSNQNPSRVRKISNQPFITAGWGLYSENLAEEMGFYSFYYSRFLRLYLKALRSLRGYVDALLHQRKISYEEAVQMFMAKMFFTRKQAEKEVLRISHTPTQNFGCILVYDKIKELRKKYRKEEQKYSSLRKFHTIFLLEGRIPIPLVEKAMRKKSAEEKKVIK
mgnify:CR=1 FL=1